MNSEPCLVKNTSYVFHAIRGYVALIRT